MNICSAVKQGTSILSKKLIKSAKLDSEILMAKVLQKDRKYILLNPNDIIDEKSLISFKKLLKERSYRKPIAQIIKKKYFWNSEFYVNEHTLIPRPDTELIIENALKLTINKNKLNILDIGVGSGCILLSILKQRQNFYGTGIDISKHCLNTCKLNAINLGVYSRLKLYNSNVDKFNLGKYDLIVSNPPYINKLNIKYLDMEVSNFEPKLALDGGLDGLSEIRKVINKSSDLIKKNGKFILEIGFDQKSRAVNLLKNEGFYINNVQKDLAKNDRCIVSTKI
tara:strand:- start:555 stop:1397 length:843 start_codon:yes stop_codon:yes gene_type:complete